MMREVTTKEKQVIEFEKSQLQFQELGAFISDCDCNSLVYLSCPNTSHQEYFVKTEPMP